MAALARLGLARACENARTAYQNFLTLWKDADPDVPILIQANAEYAKLRWRQTSKRAQKQDLKYSEA